MTNGEVKAYYLVLLLRATGGCGMTSSEVLMWILQTVRAGCSEAGSVPPMKKINNGSGSAEKQPEVYVGLSLPGSASLEWASPFEGGGTWDPPGEKKRG